MTRQHELLGVSPGASKEDIKEAYREMVQVWHPDRFTHDPKLQKKAQLRLQEINQAYEQLLKPAETVSGPPPGSALAENEPAFYAGKKVHSPRILFILITAAIVVSLFAAIQDSADERSFNPKTLSQESAPIPRGDTHRYWLQNALGDTFYIIEGPRVPLDWEIDSLVESYNDHYPKTKQSLGNFTISRTSKPSTSELIPLLYRAKDEDASK